ncbi:hypothetical protein [Vogesella indigofera]|uniref:hypothetical protein n=1 Tax=Vogesella indigofera TaxID=45465 RepID=UPI00234EDEB3|nr:hypothetical protein [Vogesella indigofera]MDC7711732.1 hypothetical protein [Vogesella indigofera]
MNEVKVLPVSEIYEGQCLHVNGFPFVKNNFDYEFTSNNEDFDHATNIVRHHIVGCCVVAEGSNEPRIRFDLTCGYPGHEEVNGMSGGLVLNVPCLGGTQYWVGMAVQVDEKNECLDFIPAASLIDAIKNYKKSTPKVIDPAAYLESEWSDAWLSAEGRQANLGM